MQEGRRQRGVEGAQVAGRCGWQAMAVQSLAVAGAIEAAERNNGRTDLKASRPEGPCETREK